MLLVLSAATACSSQTQTTKALTTIGPSATLADLYPRRGEVQRFAFPIMRNRGKKPVIVTDFKLLRPPAGIKVIDYQVYSFKDTGGEYPSSYTDGIPKGVPSGISVRLEDLPDHYGKRFVIAPGKGSDYFAMVRFRLIADPPRKGETLSGCQVTYKVDDHTERQVLWCAYELDGPDSPDRRQAQAPPSGSDEPTSSG